MSVLTSMLNHTFTVSRQADVSDGKGGFTTTTTEVGTIWGRMRPATTAETTLEDLEGRRITHVLYTAADEDIARGDSVTGDGITVDVLGVREPGRAGHHWEIDCMEVQTQERA